MTHICVSKLTIIGSDNGLSPDRRQAIMWTNAGLLLIGPLGTNFSEILTEILTSSFKKMRLKVLSVKRQPFGLCLNVLRSTVRHNFSPREPWNQDRGIRKGLYLWWQSNSGDLLSGTKIAGFAATWHTCVTLDAQYDVSYHLTIMI